MSDVLVNQIDDNTTLVTSDTEDIPENIKQIMDINLSTYDASNRMYSAYLNDTANNSTLTQTLIDTLGKNPQQNLENTLSIISLVSQKIDTNDLVGMVVQAIEDNINTGYKLVFNNFNGARNKEKTLKRAKEIISDFNTQINIEGLISQAINLTYCEGTYICVLRNNNENWVIDYYPLGIAEISGYMVNGDPVVLVNISKLKTALSKTMLKNRKRKALFFETVEQEIKDNYPKEVYDAYKANDEYAKLDTLYTGVVRINNRNRKYGLTPIFRALSSILMLDTFQNADYSSAKCKSKKIIHQIMRKEAMGQNLDKTGYDAMAFAHGELMKAYRQNTVVYTSCPAVEKIVYVEPKTEDVSVDKVNVYRNKVLSSLGVSFLANDKSQTAATSKINLQQLIQCINNISKQVERFLQKFYRVVLEANGIGAEYCPTVHIIDSEMLDANMRMDLSKMLYGTFGASRTTCFDMVGIDIEDERMKREQENSDNLNDVFAPYGTSYTTSGDDKGGRPTEANPQDENKQTEDKEYNKNAR